MPDLRLSPPVDLIFEMILNGTCGKCTLSSDVLFLKPEVFFGTGLLHRMLVGYDVTDEIFGVAVSEPGKLNPFYNYGMMTVAIPGWSLGTFFGVIMGNILPANIVSALSVGLYGMFLAIIIPPARKSKVIAALVTISMVSSYIFSRLPVISNISSGIRTIILTVVIAGIAAVLFPVKEEDEHEA